MYLRVVGKASLKSEESSKKQFMLSKGKGKVYLITGHEGPEWQ